MSLRRMVPVDSLMPSGNPLERTKERIYVCATKSQAEYLKTQDLFCSPSSFWYGAQGFGLASKQEVEAAQEHYGALWNYAGD